MRKVTPNKFPIPDHRANARTGDKIYTKKYICQGEIKRIHITNSIGLEHLCSGSDLNLKTNRATTYDNQSLPGNTLNRYLSIGLYFY